MTNIERVTKRKATIRCIEGAIWVTYRNSQDIILKPGDELELNNKRDIIIQSSNGSIYNTVS